jgi:hypothetical protein
MYFVCFEIGEKLGLEIMACVCVVNGETQSPDSHILYVLKWGSAES